MSHYETWMYITSLKTLPPIFIFMALSKCKLILKHLSTYTFNICNFKIYRQIRRVLQRFYRNYLFSVPVQNTKKVNKTNIYTKMESIAGPLSLLRKCKDERIKIKVIIVYHTYIVPLYLNLSVTFAIYKCTIAVSIKADYNLNSWMKYQWWRGENKESLIQFIVISTWRSQNNENLLTQFVLHLQQQNILIDIYQIFIKHS